MKMEVLVQANAEALPDEELQNILGLDRTALIRQLPYPDCLREIRWRNRNQHFFGSPQLIQSRYCCRAFRGKNCSKKLVNLLVKNS